MWKVLACHLWREESSEGEKIPTVTPSPPDKTLHEGGLVMSVDIRMSLSLKTLTLCE